MFGENGFADFYQRFFGETASQNKLPKSQQSKAKRALP